jgi:hypothetical protein
MNIELVLQLTALVLVVAAGPLVVVLLSFLFSFIGLKHIINELPPAQFQIEDLERAAKRGKGRPFNGIN